VTQALSDIESETLGVPASQMAHDLGDVRVANLIVLGALMEQCCLLNTSSIHLAIDQIIGNENLRDLNKRALQLGRQYQLVHRPKEVAARPA
jgi:Pyruvate/2-oxoacid:ferredoxin oxidoreductase gamma subunit